VPQVKIILIIKRDRTHHKKPEGKVQNTFLLLLNGRFKKKITLSSINVAKDNSDIRLMQSKVYFWEGGGHNHISPTGCFIRTILKLRLITA
jgi:hypothetical protein